MSFVIYNLPPDAKSVAGFEAHMARMRRHLEVRTRRTICWEARKHQPEVVALLVKRIVDGVTHGR